ncbi:MAG: chromosome segregation protein SMC [Halothiobacillaceae bacterium]|nr:chromosome segregation protein SMC [Halothiobacillaceae bacterium]
MRLTRLYLAGFKSFAAPTEIVLPDARVAIVGPNGCGKSNLIDAIRWVLGESSARQLRGAALDDVIFAGSGQRPAASQAVVELSFDNSARRLGGAFAAFDQITLRRSLGRDGQSRYEINQTRVRRRDVIDLFLGTGVGARSYSVIEQGQINRIVDARPEELRGYLEETAGISLYRERRRETQSRMTQTQENLSRLTDIADELLRQQSQLERQAQSAERYRVLQRQRRILMAEQAAVAHVLAERAQTAALHSVQQQTALVAQLALAQAEHEQARATATAARQTAVQQLQAAQARFYRVAADCAQCEGGLGALRAQLDALTAQRQADLTQRAQVSQAILQQQRVQAERESAYITLVQTQQAAADARAEIHLALRGADIDLTAQRQAWRIAQEQLAEPQQQFAAAQAELAALTRQSQRLAADAPPPAEEPDVSAWAARLAELDAQSRQAQAEKIALEQHLASLHAEIAAQEVSVANARLEMQRAQKTRDTLAAEQAGLTRLLKPAAKPAVAVNESLMVQLARAQADPWWGHALGAQIQAQCVDDLDALVRQWAAVGDVPAGGYWVAPISEAPAPAPDLAQAPMPAAALQPWLTDWQRTCHPADNLTQALSLRHRLPLGQRFVLADGWQVGRHWLGRMAQDTAAERLAQHTRLTVLADECAQAARLAEACEASYQQQHAALATSQHEATKAAHQLRAQEQTVLRSQTEHTEAGYQQQRLIERQKEQATRRQQQEHEQARLAAECAALTGKVAQWTLAVREATAQRDTQAAAQQAQESLVQQLRRKASEAAQQGQAAERAVDQNQHQRSQAAQFIARDHAVLAQIDARLAQMGEKIAALTAQKINQQAQHAALLQQQEAVAADVAAAQAEEGRATEAVQHRETQGHAAQLAHSEAQAAVQMAAVQHAQTQVRAEHTEHSLREVLNALADDSVTLHSNTIEQMADDPDTPARQAAQRESLTAQIDRLGAVNLTAIAAFAEVQARKVALDAQIADVAMALTQLTEAIATLDRQTRAQFRQIFDAVNTRIGPLFAQLFGGGEARLNLTGTDELNDGLELIARPPGKKTTQLSLLSGGERALTAVALIFALFELNPAPFCILDEVDAPLDEANVGRFCAMVSAMSDRVQFLFVTHNKTTMASANALIGVTMREAGVSRIVSVDVDRAVQLLES